MSDDLPVIDMVASLPPIQTAISLGGDNSARVKIDIPSSEIANILQLTLYTGQAFRITIQPFSEGGEPMSDAPDETPPDPAACKNKDAEGEETLAHRLHRTGYFRNPVLWGAMDEKGIYTQDEHKAWLESLPCWARWSDEQARFLSGRFIQRRLMVPKSAQGVPCLPPDVRSMVHHTRSAANAGTSIKPTHFWGIPTCDEHHRVAHSKHASREFREAQLVLAAALTAGRVKSSIKTHLGVESMADVDQAMLQRFHEEIGRPGLVF